MPSTNSFVTWVREYRVVPIGSQQTFDEATPDVQHPIKPTGIHVGLARNDRIASLWHRLVLGISNFRSVISRLRRHSHAAHHILPGRRQTGSRERSCPRAVPPTP